MKLRALFFAALVMGIASRGFGADAAAEKNPHLWKPRTTSVSVFKNGMGFFVREGEVGLRDGWAVAEEIPPATFGTLAIFSNSDKETVDMVGSGPGEVAEFDGVDVPGDLATKRKRLEASLNLKMQLSYKQAGIDRAASGKLVSVGPDFAVLERDGMNFAVPVDTVSKLQVLELPIRVHVAAEDKKELKKTTLGMAYLRKGVTWIPEYTVKIIDETTAEVSLRGTFINEAEDLIHTDVNFVVGVPNFAHSDYLAPIAVGQVIRTIGAAVAPVAIGNAIMNRAAFANDNVSPQVGTGDGIVERPVGGAGKEANPGNLPVLGGAAATDFTTYTKKDVTIRRGEKMIVTLFTKKVKYGHIYRWDMPAAMKHSLVLFNDDETALTTGPVLVMSKNQPLSEDILKYTPKSGKCEIPVSNAINIAQDQVMAETGRKLKAYSTDDPDVRNRKWLDLVTLEGKITLRNFEKDAADIVISVPVNGKPLEANESGVVRLNSENLSLLSRSGTVEWTVKVKPGETKTLTYTFERYVNSN